jgi:hypothetical protein
LEAIEEDFAEQMNRPWLVDPYETRLPPAQDVYLTLDMKTSYRCWDSFKYSKYLIPRKLACRRGLALTNAVQLLLNDLSQHLAKVEARLSGTSGAVEDRPPP